MTSFILIGSSVLLSLLVAHLVIQKFNIITPFNRQSKKIAFMSDEESLKYISEFAELSSNETEALETMYMLISGAKLHQGFEDLNILKKWLTTIRRAIAKANQFDVDTREELEYKAYEIFRKINAKRILTHPSVKTMNDIAVGQIIDIRGPNNQSIKSEFIDLGFQQFSVRLTNEDFQIFESWKIIKKKIKMDFWKVMDARYQFITNVTRVEKAKNSTILHGSVPNHVTCIQIRSFPRQITEIPIKFRQAQMNIDADTGGMIEEFGGHIFGIINNIGPRGCCIISHSPVPENTVVQVEIPLFNQLHYFKGSVCGISAHSEVFTLHISFSNESNQNSILQIYRYIFADSVNATNPQIY